MEKKEGTEGHRERGSSHQMATTDSAGGWDTESDHLLSYFLGGGEESNLPYNQAAAAVHISGDPNVVSPSTTAQIASQRGDLLSNEAPLPPSTPAVQFYHSSASSRDRSSSLTRTMTPPMIPHRVSSTAPPPFSSMAATLVSGGPMVAQHQQTNATISSTLPAAVGPSPHLGITPLHTASPISPAAAVTGTGQENLMLPPPPRSSHDTPPAILRFYYHPASSLRPDMPPPPPSASYPPHPLPTPAAAAAAPPLHHPPVVVASVPGGGVLSLPSATGAAPYPLAPMAFQASPSPSPLVENQEKRARRLARNRESARQSRRRKKEHLALLEKKVNELYGRIGTERKVLVEEMEAKLQPLHQRGRIEQNFTTREEIAIWLREMGPCCEVRRAVIAFQYAQLRQHILPSYQGFIFWLSLQRDSFYTAGKEERKKSEAANASSSSSQKSNSNRISSKQVGEEIWKQGGSEHDRASVEDLSRFWPLFCYTLSISVDQEEKALNFNQSTKAKDSSRSDILELANASRTITQMKDSILHQCSTNQMRYEKLLTDTLTVEQSTAFLKWSTTNRSRCHSAPRYKARPVTLSNDTAAGENASANPPKETSLTDLCRRLDSVLELSPGPL